MTQLNRFPALLSRVFALLCALWLFETGVIAQPPSATKSVQEAASVDLVVQGALDSELQPLLAALEGKERIQIAAWTFWRGKINGRRIVISRTEVGPINAVAATTIAIINFRPKLIINQGTAGANDPELKVFDIVIGESTVDYGAIVTEHADAGQGVKQERWTPLPHKLRLDGGERIVFNSFPGDPEALKIALETPYKRGRIVKGIVGSAFEFNREIDRLLWVRKTFGTSSEDMESAYSAGAAQGFKTRFIAIRIISDSEFYAPEIHEAAGEVCASFVLDVIKRLKRMDN